MTYAVLLPSSDVFSAWRDAARCAVSHDLEPAQIVWRHEGSLCEGLFSFEELPPHAGTQPVSVPPAFISLAKSVIWHSDAERFSLLYNALWRFHRSDGNPLSHADPLGNRLNRMAKSVGRDIHKMHAFVRFRELPSQGERRCFAAWFEPDHHIVEPGSRFFAKRFGDMDWSIMTPRLTAHFRNGQLDFTAGVSRPDLPPDASEALWATYFCNIFNPARIKLNAMRAEMPKKYWKNLPETRLIPDMLADAEPRVQRMLEAGATTPRKGAATISTRYRETLKRKD